jgi:hypothetical protein
MIFLLVWLNRFVIFFIFCLIFSVGLILVGFLCCICRFRFCTSFCRKLLFCAFSCTEVNFFVDVMSVVGNFVLCRVIWVWVFGTCWWDLFGANGNYLLGIYVLVWSIRQNLWLLLCCLCWLQRALHFLLQVYDSTIL